MDGLQVVLKIHLPGIWKDFFVFCLIWKLVQLNSLLHCLLYFLKVSVNEVSPRQGVRASGSSRRKGLPAHCSACMILIGKCHARGNIVQPSCPSVLPHFHALVEDELFPSLKGALTASGYT